MKARRSRTAGAWLLTVIAAVVGATAAAPPHPEARELIASGEAAMALDLLEPWIRKNPKDAEARLLRSTALFLQGRNDEGRSELDRAIELDPDLRQAWLNRGAYDLAEGQYDGALAAFEQAERIDPGAADNSLNIGVVLLLKGELAQATARFRRYLELHPASPEAYYLVASNYAMTGFVQPALQALTYAIQLEEKSRRRARIDPNFADVARDPRFRELLETDSYEPPVGSRQTEREIDIGFTGHDSRILKAVIRALETLGEPFDRQVEVADSWALVWAESFRIKVSRLELAKTRIELSAPPAEGDNGEWRKRAADFFRAVNLELLKAAKSGPPPPPG